MMSETLAKMRREGVRGIVLAPAWDGAPWMPKLSAMVEKVELAKELVRMMFSGRRNMNVN